MKVVIRVDGGSEIGYGHLVRSNALAEELLSANYEITVATATLQPVQEVFPDTIEIITLSSRKNPDCFIDWLETTNPGIVFTDAYPVDTAYQQAIRQHAPLAVMQDDNRHAVCADLFINGNLYAPDLAYEFVGEPPKQYLGTDYVLLRQEIREAATDEPPWREQPERAVITMGGSDIAGLTPTVVRAFDGCDLRVDAIVGPGCSAEQKEAIHEAADGCTADVHVNRDPDDLVDRIAQADFAVSTASSTTYELLALGTPIISIPVADNQEPIAAALRARDAATVLDRGDGFEVLRDAITEQINATGLRKERQAKGRNIVDAKGSERIVNSIIQNM